MMRFPSSVLSIAAKRALSSTNAAPAAFARFGALRMMSAAPSVKVSLSPIMLVVSVGFLEAHEDMRPLSFSLYNKISWR